MINKETQLHNILLEKGLIDENELQNFDLDDLDSIIAEVIEKIIDCLQECSDNDISKKDFNNILKFIKNPKIFKEQSINIITESIIYRAFDSKSLIIKINEMLSEAPNLLALHDVWDITSRDYRENFANKFNDYYKLNPNLSNVISEKKAEYSRNPDHANNFKIICNYSIASNNALSLLVTNDDTISSIPGKSFREIFSHVTNAILTKNEIDTKSNPLSHILFTESKAKYILLMMNELDRFNCLKDMSDQDKKIFARFFEQLPSIDQSQLTSINQTFKNLYNDKESSPELKFKQLVMHLNSLFDKDLKISSSNITSLSTDAPIIISNSNSNPNIYPLPQPLNQTQTTQNLFDNQEFAELFYNFTSQPAQLQNRNRHQILDLFRNGDDTLFPDLSHLGITKESLKEQWQSADLNLVPSPPLPSEMQEQETLQQRREKYYFKKEIEIGGNKISLTLGANGLEKETITAEVSTDQEPIASINEVRRINDLIYLGSFNRRGFNGMIYSEKSAINFQGLASSSDGFLTVDPKGQIIQTSDSTNSLELDRTLFEIGEHAFNPEFSSVFNNKLDLPTLFKNIDSSQPCELKKIGDLYFLGNFSKSNQGEIFKGLILKNDDSPYFFKGRAILGIKGLIPAGNFITKNSDIPLLDTEAHNQLTSELRQTYSNGLTSASPKITPIIGRDHPFAQLLIEKGLISQNEFPEGSEVDENHAFVIDFIHEFFTKLNDSSINKEDIIDLLNLIKSSEINENTQLKIFDLGKLCNDKGLPTKQIILAINEISKSNPDYNQLAIFMDLDQTFYNGNITKFRDLGITSDNVTNAQRARVAQEPEAIAQEAEAREAQENVRVGGFCGLFGRVMQRPASPNASPGILGRFTRRLFPERTRQQR